MVNDSVRSATGVGIAGRGRLGLFLALCALAGCSTPKAVQVPYPEATRCLASLAAMGAVFEPWTSPPKGACAVKDPLELSAVTASFSTPVKTSCAMALAFAEFYPELDRLARRELGQPIVSIRSAGSWACRGMSSDASRPSLHASGRALDIRGVVLANGDTVDVARDWGKGGAKDRFLRAFGKAACRKFQVVLGPPADRAHHDHLHVDLGPWRLCRA